MRAARVGLKAGAAGGAAEADVWAVHVCVKARRAGLRGAESGRKQAAVWAVRSLSEIGLSEAGLRSGPKGKGGESGPQG